MSEIAKIRAAVLVPVESTIETDVPERLVEKGALCVAVVVARFIPPAVASDPGEIAVAPGLAADKISGALTAGVEPALGGRHTPRRTSPALALRTSVNCWFAGAFVLAIVSVMETSWFGSAPGRHWR